LGGRASEGSRAFPYSSSVGLVCIVEAACGRREHARKCSGAHCNHQEQPQAKSAYGRGQDKRADAERGADLPDELMVKRIGVSSSKK